MEFLPTCFRFVRAKVSSYVIRWVYSVIPSDPSLNLLQLKVEVIPVGIGVPSTPDCANYLHVLCPASACQHPDWVLTAFAQDLEIAQAVRFNSHLEALRVGEPEAYQPMTTQINGVI